jgi:hypothetical protein
MVVSVEVAQLVLASALAGLCGTAQVAVYGHFPRLVEAAGEREFRAYHAAYMRSMGWIAAPLMLAELGLLVGAFLAAPGSFTGWAGVICVGLVWALTFGVIVPLHRRLNANPGPSLARRLGWWNWPRTVMWAVWAVILARSVSGAG